jgi:hypothetical protein
MVESSGECAALSERGNRRAVPASLNAAMRVGTFLTFGLAAVDKYSFRGPLIVPQ